MDTSKIVEIRK